MRTFTTYKIWVGCFVLFFALLFAEACTKPKAQRCQFTNECPRQYVCVPDLSICIPVSLPDAAVIIIEPDDTVGPEPAPVDRSVTPPPDKPACQNTCTQNQSKCTASGWISYCVRDPQTGCWAWSPAKECPANSTCANNACESSSGCKDACLENERRCVSGKQQSCKRQQDGCTAWGELLSCPSGQACVGDKCQITCQDACTQGQKKCTGSDIVLCNKGSNGCTSWVKIQQCKSDETCKTGTSGPACEKNSTTPTGDCGMTQEEKDVLVLVNQERAKVGASALKCNEKLLQAARSWSKEQCRQRRISHDNMSSRVRATGLSYTAAGENVAAGQRSAAAVMTGWMNSPGHRANILSTTYTHIGIGLESGCSDQYRYYWTQIFVRMR